MYLKKLMCSLIVKSPFLLCAEFLLKTPSVPFNIKSKGEKVWRQIFTLASDKSECDILGSNFINYEVEGEL